MTSRVEAETAGAGTSAEASRRPVVMLTSSYPRFPGDGVGSFIEPIAHGVGALRPVHVVAPWHPAIRRPARDGNVWFHFYRYAPTRGLHVFGYAAALKADVAVRPSVYAAAPLALAAGCRMARRVARDVGAEVVHAHWAIPSGAMAALSLSRLPLVVSLHGSDIFLAEKSRVLGAAARFAFGRADAVTACSEDLRQRAARFGADLELSTVVPYGVDTRQFAPDPDTRITVRREYELAEDAPVIVAVGRLARKKGFEFLIDAAASLVARFSGLMIVIVGEGDLAAELRERAGAHGIAEHLRLVGAVPQGKVNAWLSAADVVAVPSVHDEAGNVDGLPNVLLEALASATPVVATDVGGIASVTDDGVTARIVPERSGADLSEAIEQLLTQPTAARAMGAAARDMMCRSHSWTGVAERFEDQYERAVRRTHERSRSYNAM